LTWEEGTPAPVPANDWGSGGGGGWPWGGEGKTKTPAPTTYAPSPSLSQGEDEFEWGGDWGGNWQTYPTSPPSPRPSTLYVPPPSDEGDEIEKTGTDVASNFPGPDDNVLYHGFGGKVGAYLDQVESPQEMEKDKNVQIVAAVLGSLFLVLLLVHTHLVMNHPDSLCAGCCRLTLKVICCLCRTLCLPCRVMCCSSEQAQGRRTHTPMRGRGAPFPTDLELA